MRKKSSLKASHQRGKSLYGGGWAFDLGRNVQEIVATLGKPGKIATRKVKNRHNPNQIDTISRLFYSGLDVAMYRVGNNEKEMIILLVIKNSRYKAKFGIGIGSRKDDIIHALGEPSKEKANLLTYEHESNYAEVSFSLKNNLVSKIEWRFFPD